MHQKKRGARQPQGPCLPSIPDHHGWQLWGTVCWILNVRSESLVFPETKLKPITARYPYTHPRGPVLRLGRSGWFNDIRPLSVPSLTGQEDPVRPGCQFNDMVGPCVKQHLQLTVSWHVCAGPVLEHPACTASVTARPYMLRNLSS